VGAEVTREGELVVDMPATSLLPKKWRGGGGGTCIVAAPHSARRGGDPRDVAVNGVPFDSEVAPGA
jgi:hypothetical protein